jgi:hypothetical protein
MPVVGLPGLRAVARPGRGAFGAWANPAPNISRCR